jgi:hypothetical protein
MSINKETSVLELVINGRQAETSMNALTASVRKAEAEFRKMRQADDPKAYEQAARNIRVQKAALDEMRSSIKNVNQESNDFKTNWRDIAKGVLAGGALQEGFAMLKDFGRQVIATYTEYEKFATVLENSLGSKEAARRAMAQLQQFAAQTPFALSELTESYVKYVNRGIIPTMDEMRKLGDLASSQGKSFNQLTEAVLDAGTGEFERLKEFGIRASKNGDMVALSFKGVTQEVKFTEEAIQGAILRFGEADGVIGGMAKQSETLGGKLSNLGDTWDQLLVTMGSRTGGFIYNAVTQISGYLDFLNSAFQSAEEKIQANNDKAVGQALASLNKRTEEERMQILEGTRLYIVDLEEKMTQLDERLKGQIRDRERVAIKTEKRKIQQLIDIEKGTIKAYEDQEKQKAEVKRKAEEEKARIEKNVKEDAAKKAAEKARQEAERQRKQRESEIKSLLQSYNKELQALDLNNLDGLDKKLAEINAKYAPLIQRAKELNQTQLAQQFTDLQGRETAEATRADGAANAKDAMGRAESIAKKEFKGSLTDIKDKEVKGEISSDEARALELQKEEEFLTQQYLMRFGMGLELGDLESQLTENYLSQQELRRAKTEEVNEFIAASNEMLITSQLQAIQDASAMLAGIFEGNAMLSNAFMIFEKANAISQILTSGFVQRQKIAEQTAKLASSAAILPFPANVAAIAGIKAGGAAQMTASKINTSIAVAGVAATAVKQWKSPGKKFKKGGYIDGPSHEQGGIKLVDGITGAVIGEMEGGETIISKEQSQRFPKTIEQLLNNPSRNPQVGFASLESVQTAERFYRNGGKVPEVASSNNTSRLEVLMMQMIEAQRQANDKEVVLSMRTFEEESARRVAIKNDATS